MITHTNEKRQLLPILNGVLIVAGLFNEIFHAFPIPSSIIWLILFCILVCEATLWITVAKVQFDIQPQIIKVRYPKWVGRLFAIFAAMLTCIFGYCVDKVIWSPIGDIKDHAMQTKIVASPVADSPALAKSLGELYWQANSKLFEKLDPSNNAGVSLWFVTAPGGSGKSFLRKMYAKKYEESLTISFSRSNDKLKFTGSDGIEFRLEPELKYGEGGRYLSKMHVITDFKSDTFFSVFSSHKLVVIDGIDELHPDSVPDLLAEVMYFLENTSTQLQVVIFGRPEAFYGFNNHPSRSKSGVYKGIERLQAPKFLSLHEVLLHVIDWSNYKDVPIEHEQCVNIAQAIFDYSQKYPWVKETMGNLELGNALCEKFYLQFDWDESELKKELVSSIFSRASETHGRPAFDAHKYQDLILQFAANNAKEARTDSSFPVLQEVLQIPEHPEAVVLERSLIALSGFGDLEPTFIESQRWQFHPKWVHQFLVDEYNEQNRPKLLWLFRAGWVILSALPIVTFWVGCTQRNDSPFLTKIWSRIRGASQNA